MKNNAEAVKKYLQELPADRRTAISAIREVILANLPIGYEEGISYGMIGYVVPHKIYPAGYHCNPKLPLPLANLGSQKNHLVLHVLTLYNDPATEKWFREAWQATGKKLDMGKACVRIKKIEDVPLDVIGRLIARVPVKDYIALIEKVAGERTNKTARKGRKKTKPSRFSKAD